ncbi:hypothetical protein QTP70_004869 [Hemibagrus guttatus]|uniref:Integrase catalytic domain-containing protein n=1 Tax=Hemibagrus guttatus TaxID=175788 RepID=A0AAE0R972_9TELE|nr:hypothetical protein QTP70_004869 [Hemibagrus guttatus]KAK3569828.1 hypothetical protein QTP86_005845 [Hemibagrus guttatus]
MVLVAIYVSRCGEIREILCDMCPSPYKSSTPQGALGTLTHSTTTMVTHRRRLPYRFTPSQGFSMIVVTIDCFSKACKLIPLKGLPTAFETATALFNHVFHTYSLPEDIVSDHGPQFISQVWHAFCRQLGINVSLSLGYHPQSNGQAERLNEEIGRFLWTYCNREQHRWSEFLPWAEYAQIH